jgi:hypothetical protein
MAQTSHLKPLVSSWSCGWYGQRAHWMAQLKELFVVCAQEERFQVIFHAPNLLFNGN